jgi:hypothetical protein
VTLKTPAGAVPPARTWELHVFLLPIGITLNVGDSHVFLHFECLDVVASDRDVVALDNVGVRISACDIDDDNCGAHGSV